MRLKSSEPYKLALKKVRQNPEVVKRLGEPIEDGFVPVGEVNIENDRGSANLFFDVTGPNGTAHVMSQAQTRRRQMGTNSARVSPSTTASGSRLTPPEAATPMIPARPRPGSRS